MNMPAQCPVRSHRAQFISIGETIFEAKVFLTKLIGLSIKLKLRVVACIKIDVHSRFCCVRVLDMIVSQPIPIELWSYGLVCRK